MRNSVNSERSLSQQSVLAKIAPYIRVSTQEQFKHGVSLAEQRERLERWTQLEGWQIVDFYADEGYSGGNDNRPELQRLMADAKAGLFNAVAVTKIDRFFRNTRLLLNYIHELEQYEVSFIAQAEGIDTSKPGMGKILLSMLGSVAEWERERIGDRIKDFRAHLAGKGQWSSGRTPFGYRFDMQSKTLLVDPIEAESIRFIFQTYLGQNIGLVRTAEVCNNKNIITPRAGRRKHTYWGQSAIRHVLTHPAYKGGPNEDWPFKTPAIVDPNTWEAAQRRLASNQHWRATENQSPFQGLIRCGLCGHTMRRGCNHRDHRVWECPGRLKRYHLDGSPRCKLPRFDSTALEELISKKIAEILNNPELLDQYIQDTVNNLEKEKTKLERRLKPIQTNTTRIQEAMARVDTMYEMGRLTREDYRARISGLKARLKELEKQTADADPLLLKQLHDTEKQLKYWAGYAHLKTYFAKRGRKLIKEGEPALEIFSILQALAPTPNVDIFDHPQETITNQLRQMGLYCYVYPKNVEIKGAIKGTYFSSGYR